MTEVTLPRGARSRHLRAVVALLVGIVALAAPVGSSVASATDARGPADSLPGLTAYVTNPADNTVTPIDLATKTAGAPITVGMYPNGIAITPDGTMAYVVDQDGPDITPIDLATNVPGTPIVLPPATPILIAITPDGRTAYVIDYRVNSVWPIDLATRTLGARINLPHSPNDIAISPDGQTVYVTMSDSGNLYPISTATNTLGAPIAPLSGITDLQSIAITPNGRYAVASSTSLGVEVIDLAAQAAVGEVATDAVALGVAIAPNGKTAYVASSDNTISVVDVATQTIETTIAVTTADGNSGYAGATVSPDGKTLYVTVMAAVDGNDNLVYPIDLATDTVGSPIVVSSDPQAGSYQIAITPDQAPVASFSASEIAHRTEQFDASGSYGPTSGIKSYRWTFGDRSAPVVTTDPVISHGYRYAHSYTVTLVVHDALGTSTKQVFTGQTLSKNGGPSARTSQVISIPRGP